MRKTLLILISIVTLFFQSCQVNTLDTISKNDLFAEMEKQYNAIKVEVDEILPYVKGSEHASDYIVMQSNGECDIDNLEPWMQVYLEAYFSSDEIFSWDESLALERISNDEKLTEEQKIILAKSIAYAYYIKTEMKDLFPFYTKGVSAAECEDAFNTSVARITRNFVISGSLGLITGGIGTAVAAVWAYVAINEAEGDYNNCMKNI